MIEYEEILRTLVPGFGIKYLKFFKYKDIQILHSGYDENKKFMFYRTINKRKFGIQLKYKNNVSKKK